jgi:hypothetical protein
MPSYKRLYVQSFMSRRQQQQQQRRRSTFTAEKRENVSLLSFDNMLMDE